MRRKLASVDAKQVVEQSIFTEPKQVRAWQYMINSIRIQLIAWLMKYRMKDKRVFYLEFSVPKLSLRYDC